MFYELPVIQTINNGFLCYPCGHGCDDFCLLGSAITPFMVDEPQTPLIINGQCPCGIATKYCVGNSCPNFKGATAKHCPCNQGSNCLGIMCPAFSQPTAEIPVIVGEDGCTCNSGSGWDCAWCRSMK